MQKPEPGKIYEAQTTEQAARIVTFLKQNGYNARILPGETSGRWYEIVEGEEE